MSSVQGTMTRDIDKIIEYSYLYRRFSLSKRKEYEKEDNIHSIQSGNHTSPPLFFENKKKNVLTLT